MKFKEWFEKIQLLEVGTSTASIAVFSRPIFGSDMVRRMFPSIEDTEYKKNKKYRKHRNKY